VVADAECNIDETEADARETREEKGEKEEVGRLTT
jgi:hypothetical protein